MTQQEVIDVLEKSNVALSLKEISELTKLSAIVVSRSLKIMEKYGEIKIFYLPCYIARKFYKTKRGLKLYFTV